MAQSSCMMANDELFPTDMLAKLFNECDLITCMHIARTCQRFARAYWTSVGYGAGHLRDANMNDRVDATPSECLAILEFLATTGPDQKVWNAFGQACFFSVIQHCTFEEISRLAALPDATMAMLIQSERTINTVGAMTGGRTDRIYYFLQHYMQRLKPAILIEEAKLRAAMAKK